MKYMNIKKNTGKDGVRAASNDRTPLRLRPKVLDAFFNGKMCKRVFSLLLVLSLLLNIPAVAMDETSAADNGAYDPNIKVEAGSVESEVGEIDEYELNPGMGTDDYEANLEDNTFTFDMGLSQNVLLSTILSVNQLPLNMDQIIEVMVLGATLADETSYMGEGTECLQIEQIENDYMITVLWKFLEAGFTVYTADNQAYTFKLTPVYDPYIAERIEADLSSYSEREGIDLPIESSVGELPIEAMPDDMGGDVNEVQPVDYSYDLGGASAALLSGILVAADVPLQIDDVEMVGLLGGYADDAGRVISVTETENDYVIDVEEDFRETGIAVYTAEKQYTIALKNGTARKEAPTEAPTPEVTEEPTEAPTPEATEEPTEAPTPEATGEPTPEPTPEVTEEPTEEPTPEATEEPTEEPTPEATGEPTEEPTPEVIEEPTEAPTPEATEEPTPEPIEEPTEEPTPEVTRLRNRCRRSSRSRLRNRRRRSQRNRRRRSQRSRRRSPSRSRLRNRRRRSQRSRRQSPPRNRLRNRRRRSPRSRRRSPPRRRCRSPPRRRCQSPPRRLRLNPLRNPLRSRRLRSAIRPRPSRPARPASP